MTESRVSSAWAAATVSLAAVGLGLASYLVNVKLRLEFDPTFQSSCNFGSKLNCDLVQTSAQSSVLGYPLALWGAVTYVAVMLLAIFAVRSRQHGRSAVAALAVGGVVVCAHSVYLAYVSSFVIGAYCIYCMAMYAVNLGLTGLAVMQWRRAAPIGGVFAAVARPVVAGAVVAAVAVAAAVAVPVYSSVRAARAATRIAAAKAQVAGMHNPPSRGRPQDAAAGAKAESDVVAQPAPTNSLAATAQASSPAPQQPSAQQASAQQASATGTPHGLTLLTHPRGFRYSTEVMQKGRSFFDVPVTAADFPLGPADAPVTVVEFADFECGYCRALTANFAPLKKKYAGKVRWVFKHFPLDNHCNKVMKGTQHADACIAAKAANCAGLQGKFWQMHDRIYAHKLRINPPNLRSWAEEVGVDVAKYDVCFANDAVAHAKTLADTADGRFARIAGTPRTYINGQLVPGVNATEVLDYYLQAALTQATRKTKGAQADGSAPRSATGAKSDAGTSQHGMIQRNTARGGFWIDAFEASIDAKGRARSVSGVRPAEASWFEARDACKSAGKRLCSEEEWVSACTGTPAVDNDGDGDFSDDAVEGSLFPYGLFHEGGRCNDNQLDGGNAAATGSKLGCRSPAGVFDQSGNLAEWTGLTEATGVLSGTDFRWGPKATCMKRHERFGLGYRNATTGFRCCADAAVPPPTADGGVAAPVAHQGYGAPGQLAPQFTAEGADGKEVTNRSLLGHVTVVTFFASWCGPCRRELPDLNVFYQAHKNKGLKILAIGVDKRPQAAKEFVATLNLTYGVAFDAKALSMGAFGVKGMPTSFLVGRDGHIVERLVGINAAKVAAFKAKALALLATK